MASLQLPPLTFDDGGFRVSIITKGTSSSNDVVSSTPATGTLDEAKYQTPQPRQAIQAFQANIAEDQASDDEPDDMSEGSHTEQEDEIVEPTPPGVPNHPIPSMQAAFIESLAEVTNGGSNKPKLRELDIKARRKRLIEQGTEEEPFDALWRYRPGQRHHEVAKLVSQISFGVYLLLNGMANDTTQVINILQAHIDEVDEFLEVALEDLAEAISELRDWMDQLQLPLANMREFEQRLEDRSYRTEIIERNQQVDHVLGRTNVVMKQWDDDVDAGLVCTTSFNEWLNAIKRGRWREERAEMTEIYNAMKGNGAGWLSAFDEMNSRAQDMNGLIIQLMTTVAELEKTAGEISRKTWSTIPPFTLPVMSAGSRKNSGSAASYSLKSSPGSHSMHAGIPTRPHSTARTLSIFEDDDGLGDFPLPGMTPLLPPVRNSTRKAKKRPTEPPNIEANRVQSPKAEAPKAEPPATESVVIEPPRAESPGQQSDRAMSLPIQQNRPEDTVSASPRPDSVKSESKAAESPLVGTIKFEIETESGAMKSPIIRLDTVAESPSLSEAVVNRDDDEESPLYILQPRTYTPQLPEPVPSPKAASPPPLPPPSVPAPADSSDTFRLSGMNFPQPSSSIRERVSMKAEPPRQIRIPSQVEKEHVPFASPNTSVFSDHASSSSESADALRQLYLPRVASHMELQKKQSLLQSPNSDYQHYHPVRASPHSPLQQRPHTAIDPGRMSHHPSGYFQPQVRHQSSQLGARSTMGGAAPSISGGSTHGRPAPTIAPSMGGKSVSKKKSGAFGWLKKAFTMDDEERAAFEARKNMQHQDNYYKDKSPKFLDGKRIR